MFIISQVKRRRTDSIPSITNRPDITKTARHWSLGRDNLINATCIKRRRFLTNARTRRIKWKLKAASFHQNNPLRRTHQTTMSSNSSTTDVSVIRNGNYADILDKIESKRAAGEYSPAGSAVNSRPSSVIDHLEEGRTVSHAAQPITHRPTGFKVRIPCNS
jgi:hypothetical protein